MTLHNYILLLIAIIGICIFVVMCQLLLTIQAMDRAINKMVFLYGCDHVSKTRVKCENCGIRLTQSNNGDTYSLGWKDVNDE